jgi:hypothetical protein
LVQSIAVWRGEQQDENELFDPVTILAFTKGLEVVFESAPETIIQLVAMLIMQPENISTTQVVGISTSFIAAGVVACEVHLAIERSQARGSKNDPTRGWIPSKDIWQQRRCIVGYFIWTVPYFFTTVFAFGLQYTATGDFKATGFQCLTEIVVLCAVKASEGELFAFSLMSKPSWLDYVLGPLLKLMYWVVSCVCYITMAKLPCEMGPHVTTGLVVWRYFANAALTHLYLPSVEESGVSPWMTYNLGVKIHAAAVALSLVGLVMHVYNMDESFDRGRLWKRQTGKSFMDEVNASDVTYKDLEGGKDEERAGYISGIHPRFHKAEVVEKFICVECIAKYVDKEEGEVDEVVKKIPKWLSDPKFEKHIKIIFGWWNNPAAIERVNEEFEKIAQAVKDQ